MKLKDLLNVIDKNIGFMLVIENHGLKFKTWGSVECFRTCEDGMLNKEVSAIYNTVDGMNVVLKLEEAE